MRPLQVALPPNASDSIVSVLFFSSCPLTASTPVMSAVSVTTAQFPIFHFWMSMSALEHGYVITSACPLNPIPLAKNS